MLTRASETTIAIITDGDGSRTVAHRLSQDLTRLDGALGTVLADRIVFTPDIDGHRYDTNIVGSALKDFVFEYARRLAPQGIRNSDQGATATASRQDDAKASRSKGARRHRSFLKPLPALRRLVW